MLTAEAQYELLLEYVYAATELRDELAELRKLQATQLGPTRLQPSRNKSTRRGSP